MPLGVFYRPMMRGLMQSWFRWSRSMTIGVRALVLDGESRILLVQQRYGRGWTLPGGGLERGETALGALARELEEETAVTTKGAPKLLGVYSQEREFRGDHVLLFLVREFEAGSFAPTIEIREARFFSLKQLPADVTPGTRRRIDEFLNDRTPAAHW